MKLDLLKSIQSLENDKLSSILLKVKEIIQERDTEITLLRNKVTDLEARVIEQEIHSSKDCLIKENLPIEDRNAPLSHQVCHFFQKFLNHETRPNNFKACHYLGKWQSNTFPPAVIVKFLFFDEKKTSYWEESPGCPVKLINATVIQYISKNAYLDTRKRFLTLLKLKIWLQPQLIAKLKFSSKVMMDHIVVSKLTQKKLTLTWETKLSKKNPETMPQLQHPVQQNQAAETTIHWNVAERHLEICQPRKPKINVTRMKM